MATARRALGTDIYNIYREVYITGMTAQALKDINFVFDAAQVNVVFTVNSVANNTINKCVIYVSGKDADVVDAEYAKVNRKVKATVKKCAGVNFYKDLTAFAARDC